MYSEQHIVKTELGTFSLDDAAYASYLEGKLWINWSIGRQKKKKAPAVGKPFIPLNVSDEAIRLRAAAARQDAYSILQQQFPGWEVPVPYRERMSELTIDEMNLSVRSSNALMRANARTFGRVKEIIMMEDGLKRSEISASKANEKSSAISSLPAITSLVRLNRLSSGRK